MNILKAKPVFLYKVFFNKRTFTLDQIKNNEILSTQKDADKAMAELEKEIEKRRKK